MTADETRDERSLEVQVEAVQARGSRRGVIAAVTIGCLLAASIGVSMLASRPGADGARESALAVLPSATSLSSASLRPTEALVVEQLPEIRSLPLEGAPGLGFLRREGDDLLVQDWHPDGQGLREVAQVRDAYAGVAAGEDAIGSISHDGAFTLIRTLASGSGDAPGLIRIVSRRGVVWERRGAPATGESLWASDANRVVVPLDDGTWLVVDLEGDKPVAHTIKVEGIAPPGPPPDLDFITRPLAFSADGRWVYGEAPANVDPRNRALFRASTDGGRAKRIDDLPTEGRARAISDLFDPATGRTVDPTGFPNGTISSLVVRNRDGSRAWEARFPVIVGTAWLGDGRLIVMHSNTFDSPRFFSLIAVSGEGTVTQSLLEAGPVTDGGIFGVRNSFVLAGYYKESSGRQLLLVMVDPDDGRAGTLLLSAAELDGVTLGGWLD